MAATVEVAPQSLHFLKVKRFSLDNSVFGLLHVRQMTYSAERDIRNVSVRLHQASSINRNVRTNIFSENVFNLLRLETTLDDELVVGSDGTSGTKFRQDEFHDVLRLTVNTEIGNKRLLSVSYCIKTRTGHRAWKRDLLKMETYDLQLEEKLDQATRFVPNLSI